MVYRADGQDAEAIARVAMDGAVAEGDLWPRLPEIRVPTLILSGRKSPIVQESQ
jgi:pimeloyl-ACP methyl ester carboxylesterase